MTRPRTLNSNAATEAYIDAMSYKAQIERNEAERNKPQPVITKTVLLAFAGLVYIVGLATGVLPV